MEVLVRGVMEHFERLPVGRVPLLAASVVTALTTYFLGCQVLFCRGGSHGDSFPYCRSAPTARLSWWWLRLCLETPSHPQTLCCRLPPERDSPPQTRHAGLFRSCQRPSSPAQRTAWPVRLSRTEHRRVRTARGRSPQRTLQGRALPAGSVSRTPREKEEARGEGEGPESHGSRPRQPAALPAPQARSSVPDTGPE